MTTINKTLNLEIDFQKNTYEISENNIIIGSGQLPDNHISTLSKMYE